MTLVRLRRTARRVVDNRDLILTPVALAFQWVERAITPSSKYWENQVGRVVCRIREELVAGDVLSVDLFDTLVHRTVFEPDDVHVIVAAEARRAGLLPRDSQWCDARVMAERKARETSERPDIEIRDVYARLRPLLGASATERLEEIEKQTEVVVARPTSRGREIWRAAAEVGAAVVVSTDMYLPRETIGAILETCGYGAPARLYVSGSDGLSKLDGSTFHRIRRDFPGAKVLHIGDNERADVKVARRAGVAAAHLPRPRDMRMGPGLTSTTGERSSRSSIRSPRVAVSAPDLTLSLLNAAREEYASSSPDALSEVGYGVLGPMLAGFAHYLHATAEALGASRLAFLAREGRILREAYIAMHGSVALMADDVVLSTRMLGMATLAQPLSSDAVRFLTKTSVPLLPEEFVTRVLPDIPSNDVRLACEAAGLSWRARMTQEQARIGLRPVFERFQAQLLDAGADGIDLLVKYLEGQNLARPGTVLVDTGWAGTIQSQLNALLGVTHTGIYLGVADVPLTRSLPDVHGWLDERWGGDRARTFRRIYRRVPALEVLLADTSVGSARGITPAGVVEHLPNEFTLESKEKIAAVQSAALQFVRNHADVATSIPEGLLSPSADAWTRRLTDFLVRPSASQLDALRGVTFDGSYGARPRTLGHWWIPTSLRR